MNPSRVYQTPHPLPQLVYTSKANSGYGRECEPNRMGICLSTMWTSLFKNWTQLQTGRLVGTNWIIRMFPFRANQQSGLFESSGDSILCDVFSTLPLHFYLFQLGIVTFFPNPCSRDFDFINLLSRNTAQIRREYTQLEFLS